MLCRGSVRARARSTAMLFAGLLLAACHNPGADPARADADAPRAPPMSADASAWINGPPSPLDAALGSVAFVEAWDRFCIPCRQAVPAVLALKSRYGARGVRFVSVAAFDDAPGERQLLEAIAREEHMTYPCFLDKGSVWQHAAGTSGVIPLFMIVDRGGRIAEIQKGSLLLGTPSFDHLVGAIERALAGS
jgi:thiol-disulfide isomerase/thioredoxin